jgi:DNA-binding NarL/FixJ family response regulator
MPVNVLIADDDELIRSSLKIILDMNPDINVVGTCANGEDAFRKVLSQPGIDVILMDIRMPVCDGVLATRRILEVRPGIKIIILTTFDDDEYIFEALRNGAKGYLLKNVSPDRIIDAIKVVSSGSLLVHPDVAAKLSGMLRKQKEPVLEGYDLSETEISIIRLIADGFTNREIADRIYLSEGTVKNKISEILDKLELRDRTQIAIFYLKGGRGVNK